MFILRNINVPASMRCRSQGYGTNYSYRNIEVLPRNPKPCRSSGDRIESPDPAKQKPFEKVLGSTRN